MNVNFKRFSTLVMQAVRNIVFLRLKIIFNHGKFK